MNNWNKPYPPHYTLDKNHPELKHVKFIATDYFNNYITVFPDGECLGHMYNEKNDGTVSVETEIWYKIKYTSYRALELCKQENADLVCLTITVGEFSNGVTRIYKYDTIEKYKVNVRFYKSQNQHMTSYIHDDSENNITPPNIRVGEFTGLFGNLVNETNDMDETKIVETDSTPFTYWNRAKLWLFAPVPIITFDIRINW